MRIVTYYTLCRVWSTKLCRSCRWISPDHYLGTLIERSSRFLKWYLNRYWCSDVVFLYAALRMHCDVMNKSLRKETLQSQTCNFGNKSNECWWRTLSVVYLFAHRSVFDSLFENSHADKSDSSKYTHMRSVAWNPKKIFWILRIGKQIVSFMQLEFCISWN